MTNATPNSKFAQTIVFNARFATVKVNAEQLSPETFAQWTTLARNLQKASYIAYAQCENNGCKAESTTIDKTAIYDAFRAILAFVGDVNGHKMYANEETAIAMIGYSGRRGNVNSPELQLATSKLSLSKTLLRKATSPETGLPFNGQEDYVATLNADIAKLSDEITELLAKPDMRIKNPTRTSDASFRLELEHYLARAINGQMAKTWDELEAELEARKKANNAKAKARREAKKANAVAK